MLEIKTTGLQKFPCNDQLWNLVHIPGQVSKDSEEMRLYTNEREDSRFLCGYQRGEGGR